MQLTSLEGRHFSDDFGFGEKCFAVSVVTKNYFDMLNSVVMDDTSHNWMVVNIADVPSFCGFHIQSKDELNVMPSNMSSVEKVEKEDKIAKRSAKAKVANTNAIAKSVSMKWEIHTLALAVIGI